MVPPPEPVIKMRVFSLADAGISFHAAQKLKHLLGLPCLVPLVVMPESGIRSGVHHNGFYSGRIRRPGQPEIAALIFSEGRGQYRDRGGPCRFANDIGTDERTPRNVPEG